MALELLTADEFPVKETECLRCGATVMLRFAGVCEQCSAELDEKYSGEARDVDEAEYVPKMNVTPNAVALKDD